MRKKMVKKIMVWLRDHALYGWGTSLLLLLVIFFRPAPKPVFEEKVRVVYLKMADASVKARGADVKVLPEAVETKGGEVEIRFVSETVTEYVATLVPVMLEAQKRNWLVGPSLLYSRHDKNLTWNVGIARRAGYFLFADLYPWIKFGPESLDRLTPSYLEMGLWGSW